jgi:DNA-binding transcriptional MerR regulator
MKWISLKDSALYSGKLARLAGVSADTVRFYERHRLLPTARRLPNGYRLFPAEAILRVQMIRGALSVGFSIKELAKIFAVRDRGGTPCHQVRTLGSEKLRDMEAEIRDLRSKHRELKRTLAKWDRLLRKTSHGKRAGLLEVFALSHKEKSK